VGRRDIRRGCGGRRGSEGTRKGAGEFVEELLGGIIRRERKLGREDEG
jgi:hypothetical protein